MKKAQIFQVQAVKEGKWWTITIPELDQVTATKKAGEVEDYARDLAAIVLDVPTEAVEVEVTYLLPPAMAEEWTEAREATEAAKKLTIEAAAHTKEIILKLTESGYTTRDIEKVSGLSFQRVSQIINS